VTAADVLTRGRDRHEALMVDAGELRGPDVRGELDPVTRTYPTTPGELKYAGKARLQTVEAQGREAEALERTVMRAGFVLQLPMSAPAAAVDDVWTHTASDLDPELVGRRFRVVSLIHKTHMTARRIQVEEIQS
jgi:hypothetical protein